MTEQEIEDVAKAIYLLRVAPRRLPRKWDELTIKARRSFDKDAIAAIMAPDALRLGRTADQCVEVKILVLFLRIAKPSTANVTSVVYARHRHHPQIVDFS
jgi:hypothetical protein